MAKKVLDSWKQRPYILGMCNNTTTATETTTLAQRVVSTIGGVGGCAAVKHLATYGYNGPEKYSFEELNAIQDEAKAQDAMAPETIWDI